MIAEVQKIGERPRIFRIVVLYRPDPTVIARLQRTADAGWPVVVVFNEASAGEAALVRQIPQVTLIELARNEGLARALNVGIERALSLGATHISMFDQDSDPPADMEERLLRVLVEASPHLEKIAAVGPTPRDAKDSSASLRQSFSAEGSPYVEVKTLITSGTLYPAAALSKVGPMWEELFIDGIDHEWCLRSRLLGWHVIQAVDVQMPHNLGDKGLMVLGRFKGVHVSPMRHYHIIRNTLAMLRIKDIPLVWRLSEGLKTLYRIPAYLAFSANRLESVRLVVRAVIDHRAIYATRPQSWRN